MFGKRFLLVFTMVFFSFTASAGPNVRLKDVARFDGVRDNQLIGYGLVVGLQGTGDSAKSSFTVSSIVNMLTGLGIPVDKSSLSTKNVAAVLVTATLPAFAKEGSRIDVTVSAIGDAASLGNGTLLQTPLRAANKRIYAVAQGQVSTGESGNRRAAASGFKTVGRIASGAIIERSLPGDILKEDGTVDLILNRSDFTTSARIAAAINREFKSSISEAADPARVTIHVPKEFQSDVTSFASRIEEIYVDPDNRARVIVNERTGTVVIGDNVRIESVAVSHGELSVTVRKTEESPLFARQQQASSDARNQQRRGKKEEDKDSVVYLQAGASVADLVRALNSVGARPRDIIAILQAISEAGALHAELIFI